MRKKHQSIASCTCPNQGLNLQPRCCPDLRLNPQSFCVWGDTPTNFITQPGLRSFLSVHQYICKLDLKHVLSSNFIFPWEALAVTLQNKKPTSICSKLQAWCGLSPRRLTGQLSGFGTTAARVKKQFHLATLLTISK